MISVPKEEGRGGERLSLTDVRRVSKERKTAKLLDSAMAHVEY